MFKYPTKTKVSQQKNANKESVKPISTHSYANLGMRLEKDLEETHRYYLKENIAVIHKKPTPIKVVDVSYPARNKARITEAYYVTASTTDFNGVYRGFYLDFDAKEVSSSTSLPFANIHAHQINHLYQCQQHGGIGFLIVHFKPQNEYFVLEIEVIYNLWLQSKTPGGRKSIPYSVFKDQGILINFSYYPRLDYLKAIDELIKRRSA